MEIKERAYIAYRLIKGKLQSVPFFLYRIFPIKKRKIVFTTIEGTTGFTCNPKYIALELIKRNKSLPKGKRYELVWLVNDTKKQFPKGIRKVRNTLLNRAFELTTARVWVDNSRKQLEVRKRRGQTYIQTWHAKLGFKPTCLDRGASFSRIAYLVSKHDSDMVDVWLSNSDWYDQTLPTGSLYNGKALRSGSPRCDILVKGRERARKRIRELYGIPVDVKLLFFCPTFRGGSQGVSRDVETGDHMPDFDRTIRRLQERFGGDWRILLRLHPQLTARNIKSGMSSELHENLIDVSSVDDMYEILAGCDAFMTDYSSAAFDAAVMRIPIFLYCDDYIEYEGERGRLLWDLRKLPFPLAVKQEDLDERIRLFDADNYKEKLESLFMETGMVEDGNGSRRVADFICSLTNKDTVLCK